jgi:hypothetical protein
VLSGSDLLRQHLAKQLLKEVGLVGGGDSWCTTKMTDDLVGNPFRNSWEAYGCCTISENVKMDILYSDILIREFNKMLH